MFTGIISDIGTIIKSEQKGDLRLEISCEFKAETIKLVDSICCNGVCLTVVDIIKNGFAVQLSAETINCTAKNSWQVGGRLNLERSLKIGDTIDGHLVSGHIDGAATISKIEKSGESHVVTIVAPQELAKFIAQKGSVTLDGISLTVNNVDSNKFTINIIPHTWQFTTLGNKKVGEQLNIEIDMLARYVARMLGK